MGFMCGRYVMSKATGDLVSHFEAKEVEGSPPPPSWNVAPTQAVPIVAERLDEGSIERHVLTARWGLVPSWAKDIKIGSKLINARSESILEKPSFRKAAVKRRAIVPATHDMMARNLPEVGRSAARCEPKKLLISGGPPFGATTRNQQSAAAPIGRLRDPCGGTTGTDTLARRPFRFDATFS
jgi:hypothetical protein